MTYRNHHLMKRLQSLRVRLAWRLLPMNGGKIVANRQARIFTTPKAEVSLVIRDKTKPDGYSWEEMIAILDVFLGRQTTDEEWREVLSWKKL
jgi:hypothetical protein